MCNKISSASIAGFPGCEAATSYGMKYNQELTIEFDITPPASVKRLCLKVARIIHGGTVFTAILAVIFLPFGDIVNQYAREHLPEKIAGQIARVIPDTETAEAAINSDVYVFFTYSSGSSGGAGQWTVPLDWNSASNSIEAIGGGGTGGDSNNSRGAGGGGGGAYSLSRNLVLTPGSALDFTVGASGSQAGTNINGGNGGGTWFNDSTSLANCVTAGPRVCVGAAGGIGGGGAVNNSTWIRNIGGAGGAGANGSGDTKTDGGKGGNGATQDGSGGGGGAGSQAAAGKNGGLASNGGSGGGGAGASSAIGNNGAVITGGAGGAGAAGTVGGAGGNNSGACGAGGSGQAGTNAGSGGGGGKGNANAGCSGGVGAAGTQWANRFGSGGGGGGAGDSNDNQAGGQGGKFGAGGGGGSNCPTSPNCRGANGVIVAKYRPVAVQTNFQWFNDSYALNSQDNLASISAEGIMASGSEALVTDTTYRLRFQIARPDNKWNGFTSTNTKFRLEMTRASTSMATCDDPADGWRWITASASSTAWGVNMASAAFDIEGSSQVFADYASTSQLLSTPSGTTNFTAGYAMDVRATSGYQTIADNAFTEMEWTLKPNSNVNTSASYCFRTGWMINDATTPDTISSMTYSKIASASIFAPTTFTQNVYRWYYNIDDANPTGPMAGENTSTTILTTQKARLRLNITIGGSSLAADTQAFKLKYSTSQGGPYDDDVGATTSFKTWRFNENPSVAHGAAITTIPLNGSDVAGLYMASNSMPNNPNLATNGQDIEYDFSLDPSRANPGTTYYFRVFEDDDSALAGQNNHPTIIIQSTSPGGGGGGGGGTDGGSGGGNSQAGGAPGGGGGGACPEGNCSGGGNPQGGGNPGGGGASPVIFDWRWLLGSLGRWVLGI